MNFQKLLSSIALPLLLLSPFACADELDAAVDCGEICSAYSDCMTDIDVTACTEQCEAEADASDDYLQAVDTCDDCVSSGACAEIESCWADCPVEFIPE